MTLLIACLLIYHFNLPAWWYAFAAGTWVVRAWAIDFAIRRNVSAIRHYISEAPGRSPI